MASLLKATTETLIVPQRGSDHDKVVLSCQVAGSLHTVYITCTHVCTLLAHMCVHYWHTCVHYLHTCVYITCTHVCTLPAYMCVHYLHTCVYITGTHVCTLLAHMCVHYLHTCVYITCTHVCAHYTLHALTHTRQVSVAEESDSSVVETKSKVLEILQFVINVRLDLRITNLLIMYKQAFKELEANGMVEIGGCGHVRVLTLLVVGVVT